jgi:hypothetical protein
MKIEINVFGGDASTVDPYKDAKPISWKYDFSSSNNLYINQHISEVFFDLSSNKKYAWINESKSIIPNVYDDLYKNIDQYYLLFDGILTHTKDLYQKMEKAKFVPASQIWVSNLKIYKKDKLISMITSNKLMCEGHKIRMKWADYFIDKVDMYGIGFNPIEKKEEGLDRYMFSVAIENACYESYFTEKILDCFATGTIPVYLGTPDIGDFFNLDGIIILDDNFDIMSITPDLYYSKMDAIKDNFERVKEYIFVENHIAKQIGELT